jgi:signal transduction histidine kinase
MLYANRSLNGLKDLGYRYSPGNRNTISKAYENLYKAYMLNNKPDSVLKYLQFTLSAKDSLNKAKFDNLAKFQALTLEEQFRLQKLEEEKANTKNRIRTYSLLAGVLVLLVIGFILYRNNRQKQKANIVLESTLSNLKSAQSQLIQSEKMASLGELTAGIAHEIQNPLNFVNNFSEVNKELISELKEEIEKGDLEEIMAIANDIEGNEEKIHHHGQRASGIVKGMLEHSRTSDGKKELTDLNALADEYLRLAYHGLRAKDNSFNADFKTEFDESLPKVNVVPQDIGRVLLNLINNAFFAVNQKSNRHSDPEHSEGEESENYQPKVVVSTRRLGGKIEITVKDNGPGIPAEIKDKIFQPFFTTKPTGSGTGLGLSLSYDIVKAHGGELKVETKEGEGSEFIIQLTT